MKKSPKVKWIIAAVAALCLVLFVKSFVKVNVSGRLGYFEDDKRLATAAVERFHAQINAGQFQTIYNEAAPAFQSAGGPGTLIAAMTQSKQKFGDVIQAVQVAAKVFPGGQVRFVYNTRFQKGDATEMFIWQSDGQKASLVLYKIQSGTVKPNSNSTNTP
jgi:hypothetical protein